MSVCVLSECVCCCNCADCMFVYISVCPFSFSELVNPSLSSSKEDEDSGVEIINQMGAPVLNSAEPCCYTTGPFLIKAGVIMYHS